MPSTTATVLVLAAARGVSVLHSTGTPHLAQATRSSCLAVAPHMLLVRRGSAHRSVPPSPPSPFDPIDDHDTHQGVPETPSPQPRPSRAAHSAIPPALRSVSHRLRTLFDARQAPSVAAARAAQRAADDAAIGSSSIAGRRPARWGVCGVSAFESPRSFARAAQLVEQEVRFVIQQIETDACSTRGKHAIVARLDAVSNLLCCVIDACNAFRHLHTSAAVVAAANRCHQHLVSFMNVLNTTPALYNVLKAAINDPEVAQSWSPDTALVADLFLRDFVKSGITMSEDSRKRFVQLSDEIGELSFAFVADQGPGKRYFRVDEPFVNLAGIPAHIIRDICGDSTSSVNLPTSPMYIRMILEHCAVESTRQLAYFAKFSVAKNQMDTLNRLMDCRHELARLVGRTNYVDLVLDTNLIRNVDDVMTFLKHMDKLNRPHLEHALAKLTEAKRHHTGDDSTIIQAWDEAYYQRILDNPPQDLINRLKSKGLVDNTNELPEGGPITLGEAFDDLGAMIHLLYGLRLSPERSVPGECWSDDVHKLVVYDSKNNKVGIIYCDLFGRAADDNQKPQGAVHYTIRCSKLLSDTETYFTPDLNKGLLSPAAGTVTMKTANGTRRYQLPIVILSTNFYKSTNDRSPTMLSKSEVRTLYHEMGHALHSMIGRTDYQHISGTRVPIDFVEVPSVLMESFADIPPSVPKMDSIALQFQIFLSVLDQVKHLGIPVDVAYDYHPFKVSPALAVEATFGHLAGYGGSYYSYLLSRRLVSQILDDLKIDGLDDSIATQAVWSQAGDKIYNELLKHGGGRDPWIGLRAFNATI